MKPPEMTAVKSSNIASIGHRGTELFVRFQGGGLYSYEGVPADVYEAGLKSESVGSWFALNVRGQYKHRKHDA